MGALIVMSVSSSGMSCLTVFIGLLYANDRFVSIADDPESVPHLEGGIVLSNVFKVSSGSAPWWRAALLRCHCRHVFAAELHGGFHVAMMGTSRNSPTS